MYVCMYVYIYIYIDILIYTITFLATLDSMLFALLPVLGTLCCPSSTIRTIHQYDYYYW